MAAQLLTDPAIKQAVIQKKQYKLSDGDGLYLLIKPNGTKCWRLDYRFAGKRKTLAMGTYPTITLKSARAKLLAAKMLLADNKDPAEEKQRDKRRVAAEQERVFEIIAKEWWYQQKGTWKPHHADRVWGRIRNDVLPYLGSRSIADILPQDIIAVVRKIESRGSLDVASRVLQDIGRICRYAVQTGRLTQNPTADLQGILKGRKLVHRPSLPPGELPGFLLALDDYDKLGRLLTKLAILLLLHTFVRPGVLRGARWKEFDLEQKLWRIPSKGMKMDTDHIVPLADQAVAIVQQIKAISGQYELLFPSERIRTRPMSDNTMRRAIFKLGYDGKTPGKSKAVPHGFRATAASILNEEGYNPDAIERQLAHQERNGVRAAYTHHARYLDERRELMQWWADYLTRLNWSDEDCRRAPESDCNPGLEEDNRS